MKNHASNSDKETRHGKVPEGWMKQSFQLPKSLAMEFRDVGGEMGHGGIKILGTAAIAFIMSLDDKDKQIICNYVRQKTWSEPDAIEPSRIKELVRMLIDDKDDSAPIIEPVWFVDKIVDPELSQPPGKKLSDKKKPKGKRGSA